MVKKTQTGKWQADYWFKDSSGKRRRHRKCFRTKSEGEAWSAEQKKQRGKLSQAKSSHRTILEMVEWYKGTMRYEQLRPKSKSTYESRIKVFQNFCAKNGITHSHQIDRKTADDYIRFLTNNFKGEGISAMHNMVTLLFNEELNREDAVLTSSPFAHRFRPKRHRGRIRWFSDEELSSIFGVMDDFEHAVFSLLLNTGMRVGEFENLTWFQVQHKPSRIEIRNHDGWVPKWRHERQIALNESAMTCIDYFRSRTGTQKYVLNLWRDAPTGANFLNKLYHKLLLRISDLRIASSLAGTSAKTFRSTFGSLAVQAENSYEYVGELLGHRDIRTTMRHYASLRPENTMAAVKKLETFIQSKEFRHMERHQESKNAQES